MFCGSCMHDNAIAKALIARGNDCLLQPIYTPIRTDDRSVANKSLFFGGIHVYLTQKVPWLGRLPRPLARPLRRVLNSAPLIQMMSRRAGTTDAAMLGDLANSMLKGIEGAHAEEVLRLTRWIRDEVKPDVIVLSNLLIGGVLPTIRSSIPDVSIAVMLQGDDLFLEQLPEPSQSEAIDRCRGLVRHVDQFIANSEFYCRKMGDLFAIEPTKLRTLPLSIDASPFVQSDSIHGEPRKHTERFNIGFLARIAPEKGLHQLVDAFIKISGDHDMHLHVAGWLGAEQRRYFSEQVQKMEAAGLTNRFTHHGSPTLAEKVSFLSGLDLLCVPTQYEEPKGLFVLESLAAGTPVLQPDHGAFGELLKSTQGGRTFRPLDTDHLAESLASFVTDPMALRTCAEQGRRRATTSHGIERAAERFEALLTKDPSEFRQGTDTQD